YTSMVIYADGNNFSVGANLYLMKQAHESKDVENLVGPAIDNLHKSFNRMKYSLKPIVTAVHGRALGGGCEVVLHSPFVVAASETYIGLVETGVGLLPSGGGLAELSDRVLRTNHKENDKQESISKVLMNVGLAKVETTAYDTKRYGNVRDTASSICNKEARVEVALNKARYESETSYLPSPMSQDSALGTVFKALSQAQLDALR